MRLKFKDKITCKDYITNTTNTKMYEEIKTDSNCIIKAFEHTNITIVKESNIFLFRGTDIGKVLGLTNIRVTIQNFDEDERVVNYMKGLYNLFKNL